MYFLIEDEQLLKKYYDIWKKVSHSTEKEFNSEFIYKIISENQNKILQ